MNKTKSSNVPRVSTLRLWELAAACDAVLNVNDNKEPVGPDSIVTVTRHYNGVLDKYKVICYMDSQTFDVDKKIRDRTDAMFLQVNVARCWSVGKRIIKKIKLVEASAEGESRIAEDLAFAPFWTWTLTYIPRWAGKFDSNAVIDKKPYINYTVVGSDTAPCALPDADENTPED